MLVTPSGMSMLVRAWQPQKAELPIEVRVLGKEMVVRELHP